VKYCKHGTLKLKDHIKNKPQIRSQVNKRINSISSFPSIKPSKNPTLPTKQQKIKTLSTSRFQKQTKNIKSKIETHLQAN
jgi:RNA processing factor Prp31